MQWRISLLFKWRETTSITLREMICLVYLHLFSIIHLRATTKIEILDLLLFRLSALPQHWWGNSCSHCWVRMLSYIPYQLLIDTLSWSKVEIRRKFNLFYWFQNIFISERTSLFADIVAPACWLVTRNRFARRQSNLMWQRLLMPNFLHAG